MNPHAYKVAGVDGCKAGWVVAVVSATVEATGKLRYPLAIEDIQISPHFADVLLRTYNCKLVCVDIPIGLSDGPEPRTCDVAARKLLGQRASSIFTPPVRACFPARSYPDAAETHRKRTSKGLSKQSFFIMDKIREVDELLTPAMQARVREIHPEVTFCSLNGNRPLKHNKRTLAGRDERIALLAGIFPSTVGVIERFGKSQGTGADDILDALAAAWTAAAAVAGQAATLPEQPERDGKGLRMEILRPVAALRMI